MYLLLISRAALFLIIQLLFSGYLRYLNSSAQASSYWPLVATIGSVVSLSYLLYLLKKQNSTLRNFFDLDQKLEKKDYISLLLFLLLLFPIAFLPNILLGNIFLDSNENSLALLISDIPLWVKYLSLTLFPLSIAVSEIPIYYKYLLPRLSKKLGDYQSLILVAFFHSFQHIFLPFIPNWNFILWRFLMFMPFAFLIGIFIKKKPKLLPYIMAIHFLMDLSTGFLIYYY